MNWLPLRIPPSELRLSIQLNCGQSFRWVRTCYEDDQEFTSVLENTVVTLKQTDTDTFYALPLVPNDASTLDMMHQHLHTYFQSHVSLKKATERWAVADPLRFSGTVAKNTLVTRILRMDPTETLFAFICSSNNNIQRITQMVQKLCRHFGEFRGTFRDHDFHAFPCIQRLAQSDVEPKLRELGFGYRAKYIHQTAQHLCQRHADPEAYLMSLREMDYADARQVLLACTGVGPKVADCVCLMSLDKWDFVPVDTHVRQIAERLYGVKVKGKTLTEPGYVQIQDRFRELFGEDAGWAHAVLFARDLKFLSVGDLEKLESTGK